MGGTGSCAPYIQPDCEPRRHVSPGEPGAIGTFTVGTSTVFNTLQLAAGSVLHLDITAAGTDQVVVNGPLDLKASETLEISNPTNRTGQFAILQYRSLVSGSSFSSVNYNGNIYTLGDALCPVTVEYGGCRRDPDRGSRAVGASGAGDVVNVSGGSPLAARPAVGLTRHCGGRFFQFLPARSWLSRMSTNSQACRQHTGEHRHHPTRYGGFRPERPHDHHDRQCDRAERRQMAGSRNE